MPSVNLRQLRDTRQLLTWLEAGEVVELRKRNRVCGTNCAGIRRSPHRSNGRISKLGSRGISATA